MGACIWFGTDPGTRAEFRAEKIEERGVMGSAFDFVSPAGRARLGLPLIGRHNVMNALAALAAASVWGIGAEEAQRVLPQLTPADKRGEVVRFEEGFTVINDSYNSSPTALDALARLLADTTGYHRAGFWRRARCSSWVVHRRTCTASAAAPPRAWRKLTGSLACRVKQRNSFTPPSKQAIRRSAQNSSRILRKRRILSRT